MDNVIGEGLNKDTISCDTEKSAALISRGEGVARRAGAELDLGSAAGHSFRKYAEAEGLGTIILRVALVALGRSSPLNLQPPR